MVELKRVTMKNKVFNAVYPFLPHWCLRVVEWAALQLLSLMEDGGICFSITSTLKLVREEVVFEIPHQKLTIIVTKINLDKKSEQYKL